MAGNEITMHPFHHANIHERRFAAQFARSMPMGSILLICAIIAYGVFRSSEVLLIITAVLNVSMWLWICSISMFGILGASTVRATLESSQSACPSPEDAPREGAAAGDAVEDGRPAVRHVIVFPNYKEDEEMLAETCASIREAKGSSNFWVVLAMEESEGAEVHAKAERLRRNFEGSFAKMLTTFHPTNLEENHLDGSSDPEVPGKASNLKWAVKEAHKVAVAEALDMEQVVLTVADADCLFHPGHFASITADFNSMREAPGDQHKWTMWQAPQLPYRNYYPSPIPARAWGYISSMYEFGGISSVTYGGHHMVFSAYSVPLQLAVDAQLWDGDVIAEDHHAYIKCFLYSARASAMESLALMEAGEPTPGCRPRLRVRPIMLPVKSTSVIDPAGYWPSWVARWHQATRHCQGVAELSYSMLATYDLLCTLPLRVYNLHFLTHLFKVVFRPFLIHIVPVGQSIALGVLTLYWLLHNRSVPMCPDRIWMASSDGETLLCGLAGAWVLTWPVVIPFTLLALCNYRFLSVAFTEPALQNSSSKRPASIWHGADGSIPRTCGSSNTTVALLIIADCVIFLGPVMVVYGLCAEIVGCWNVLWKGNRFKYVTAAKLTASSGQDYGTLSRPPASAFGPPKST
mmetsp:Transcript_32905/g.86930  ORF Transcript_32905/g.86930 Transcript_32905/m.86930 type:complete len:633 (+) Transcript_32905:95-1993(+)